MGNLSNPFLVWLWIHPWSTEYSQYVDLDRPFTSGHQLTYWPSKQEPQYVHHLEPPCDPGPPPELLHSDPKHKGTLWDYIMVFVKACLHVRLYFLASIGNCTLVCAAFSNTKTLRNENVCTMMYNNLLNCSDLLYLLILFINNTIWCYFTLISYLVIGSICHLSNWHEVNGHWKGISCLVSYFPFHCHPCLLYLCRY